MRATHCNWIGAWAPRVGGGIYGGQKQLRKKTFQAKRLVIFASNFVWALIREISRPRIFYFLKILLIKKLELKWKWRILWAQIGFDHTKMGLILLSNVRSFIWNRKIVNIPIFGFLIEIELLYENNCINIYKYLENGNS